MHSEPGGVHRYPEVGCDGVLRCARAERNGCMVVSAAGEIDWATAPVLREQLAGAMAAANPPRIFLDLAKVTFLDSSGLSVMIRARRQAEGRGGWVALVVPADRSHVRRILQMTGTDQVFPIFRSLEAALAKSRGAGGAPPVRERALGDDYRPVDWLGSAYLRDHRAEMN